MFLPCFSRVAIETDFHKVKAAKAAGLKAVQRPGKSLWRRGVVGDWRRHLTPAMSERVDAKMREEWAGTPLLDYFNFGAEDNEEKEDAVEKKIV